MQKSFFQKFIVCLLGGLVAGRVVMRLGQRFLFPWIPPMAMMVLGLLILIVALIYPFAWDRIAQHRKKDPKTEVGTMAEAKARDWGTERIFSCWIGIIRYSIALDLIMVGMQKWFHLQFNTPIAKLDLPFSSFSSENLSWAFFGHSHGFVMVIGGLQILGSLFLLFNRTRLLGTVVLIPVMLNITLMDLFYQFDVGEWVSALILLTALVYVLLLDYERLAALFLKNDGSHPALVFKNNNRLLKNAVRLSAVCIPLAMICINPMPYVHDRFMGKYTVDHLVVNAHPLIAASCMDSVLTVVYIDQGNECVFEYNSRERRLFGTYHLDETGNNMTVIWHYPKDLHDTLQATLSRTTLSDAGLSNARPSETGLSGSKPQTSLTFSGKMGNTTMQASLRKIDQ